MKRARVVKPTNPLPAGGEGRVRGISSPRWCPERGMGV